MAWASASRAEQRAHCQASRQRWCHLVAPQGAQGPCARVPLASTEQSRHDAATAAGVAQRQCPRRHETLNDTAIERRPCGGGIARTFPREPRCCAFQDHQFRPRCASATRGRPQWVLRSRHLAARCQPRRQWSEQRSEAHPPPAPPRRRVAPIVRWVAELGSLDPTTLPCLCTSITNKPCERWASRQRRPAGQPAQRTRVTDGQHKAAATGQHSDFGMLQCCGACHAFCRLSYAARDCTGLSTPALRSRTAAHAGAAVHRSTTCCMRRQCAAASLIVELPAAVCEATGRAATVSDYAHSIERACASPTRVRGSPARDAADGMTALNVSFAMQRACQPLTST